MPDSREYGACGPLVCAVDEGTSSARCIIFKAGSAEVVASHQRGLRQILPQEGWVEQDPAEILAAVEECMEAAAAQLEARGASARDVVAVGVTNQRETTIVWDKTTGRPLHNAIVWLDIRTTSTVEKLLDTVPNKTRNQNYLKPLCGLPLSPYFSAVKLRWLIDNVEAVRVAVKNNNCYFGTVDTWLIWNLTGGLNGGKHITDVTNASRTMLMNIDTLEWDPLLLKFFEIPSSVLAEIRSSAEVYGALAGGRLAGAPLSGCLGDQQAALVGQRCLRRGEAKATYGTGCFVLYNTGEARAPAGRGLLATVAYRLGAAPPVYALEGSVAAAGAALRWLADAGLLAAAADSEAAARRAQGPGGVVFVPAFSGLLAPHWRPDARGVVCGLTEDTRAEHIVHAALEAICFQVRDILEAMRAESGAALRGLRADGGVTHNELAMQLQADLIGLPVTRAAVAESTALGAALAAAWGAGAAPAPPAGGGGWGAGAEGRVFTPRLTEDERNVRYKQWKTAVERSLGWEQA